MSSEVNNTRSKPRKRGVYSPDDPTKIFEFVEQLGKGFVNDILLLVNNNNNNK